MIQGDAELSRSRSLRSGRTSRSMSSSTKVSAYCASPWPFSQRATSAITRSNPVQMAPYQALAGHQAGHAEGGRSGRPP